MFKRITCFLLLFIPIWIQSSNCLSAQESGGHPTPTQSPPPQNTGAQNSQEVTTLESGVPIEREFAEGQKHSYQITLAEGQYIRVEIKQLGMDVRVSLQPPDSKIISIIDIPQSKPEVAFEWVAESTGIYRLDLYARTKAPTGRYEIRLAQLRPATEDERALQQSRNLFAEFFQLHRDGKYLEARPLLIRALEIRERVLGPEHLEVAETLGHLGNNYTLTGDYASAEPIRQRALKIKEKLYGPDHPEVAGMLQYLGNFYNEKGDYLKAEEMFHKALGIFEKTRRTESITVASVLANLGDIYYGRGDYENAENYYQRALAIREKLMGPDHFHLAASLDSIGRSAYDAGDYAKAEKAFQRSLTLTENAFGQDHMQLTSSLNDLAMLYGTTGDYAKAEVFYRRALSIHEQKAGMNNPNAQETLFGLARLYAARGRSSEALKFQSRASELEERFIGLNLAVGSEREKLVFLDKLSLRSSRNISLHADLAPDDPTARDLAVTAILRRKGRVQDAMSESLAALRLRSGAEERRLLDGLNDATSKLANLVLNGPQKMTSAEYQEQIKALDDQRERLEAEISRRSAGFYQRSQPATLAAVQRAIPDGAALIEFAAYRPFDPIAPDNKTAYREPRYVAYVVRRQGEVQWKELGAAKEIDARVDALRRALRDPRRKDLRKLARAVDEKVMQPVRALLGDATRLLVSPDGALNLIPFETLVDEGGRYLIESYSATYLTSGRDLLRMGVARESKSSPTVIANPSFGEPVTQQATRTNTTRKPAAPGGRRRSGTAARTLSDVYFAPLGGTAQEARTIQTLFSDANLLTGAQATESALKLVSAPRVLHVATHGFFLEDGGTLAPSGYSLTAARGTAGTSAGIQNPLLRSGLALAGANLRGGVAGGDDDGVLTALEASGLNLWGTKLVVLSACDTGLGEVRNGEGVYGLRRAFALAGAESLVMSLWPVSDYSTRKLMASYYRNLKQGMGRGESLRQVQLDLLKRNPQLHPFYWASFIQSGEWANLDGKR